MKRYSKRYRNQQEKTEKKPVYTSEEAIASIKSNAGTKFDETVEIAFRLGLDLKKMQQPVRGSVNLPHGSGKVIKVLVFAQGEHVELALKAGADYVGADDMIEKIKGGWLDFHAVVSTPDMMRGIAALGKILGPRGLMPNPKMGTVTFDVGKIVNELKKGRVEFKMDKDGNIHFSIGKVSFQPEQLIENLDAALRAVFAAKPAGVKGVYLKTMHISATMSQSFPINVNKISQEAKLTVS